MVHRSSNNTSSLVEDGAVAVSVCTVLNGGRVVIEEFPRVERTEIVRLEEDEETKTENVESFSVPAVPGGTECFQSERERVQHRRQRQHQHQHQHQQSQRKSGRFSLFNWFKRTNSADRSLEVLHQQTDNEDINKKSSDCKGSEKNHRRPEIPKERDPQSVIYSSSGSVDTTCSTATVHSFTFRSGFDITEKRRGRLNNFRKHFSADDFAAADDAEPRRSRVGLFDSEPSIDRDSSVRVCKSEEDGKPRDGILTDVKKNDCTVVSSAKNLSDKKNAKSQSPSFYRSLPTAGKSADLTKNKKRYSHVRGKRRAPEPPIKFQSLETARGDSSALDEKTSTVTIRRKRRAPKPPVDKTEELRVSETKNYTRINNTASNSLNAREKGVRNSRESSFINDTLKLEGGILLPIKSVDKLFYVDMNQGIVKTQIGGCSENGGKKSASCNAGQNSSQAVNVPRPWYKRSNTTLSERDICGSFRREVLKIPTLSKYSRDKGARFSLHHDTNDNVNRESAANCSELNNSFDKSFSRLNHLFGRNESACRTKKDEKRKSNLSILTNISELDREAAAIVQEEQARNQAIAKSLSSSATNDESLKTTSGDIISEIVSSAIEPQRRGTRALISKFNAISNITKVTVNATFFTKSSGSQTGGKIDVVRAGDQRVSRNDRNIVTKRLLCDGTERVNETAGDLSSINFFRRLEAEASSPRVSDNSFNITGATPGWEEKIKRYFPERESSSGVNKKEFTSKAPGVSKGDDHFGNIKEARNIDGAFEINDNRRVDKIENLSRADLKEMLIEMKHSLPKRPKPKSSGVKSNVGNNERVSNARKGGGDLIEGKLLAGKIDGGYNRLGKLETRSRISGGKIQQQLGGDEKIVDINKTKVSSAAQTSANIRKVELIQRQTQLPRERQQRVVETQRYDKYGGKRIPEDHTIYTTKGRKNGNGGGGGGLGRNTFQLIRPRDFACIEALKTEKGGGGRSAIRESQNTYMNVIEDSIYANAIINPLKVINGEDKSLTTKIQVGGNNRIDKNEGNNAGGKIADNFKHRNSNVVADFKAGESEPRKPDTEMRALEENEKSGGAEGKAAAIGPETNMNTMAINRLLRKLEGAIASGQHQQAAGLAKELAQLKIHCSVVRQRTGNNKTADFINVDMYIEDKLAHQGPIPLQLSLNMTVAELKNKVFAEFEIPANVQRWIIGKNLADNDDFTINELKAVDKSSIFLYLVAPDLQNDECTRVEKPVVKEEAAEAFVDEEPREIVPILEEEVEILQPKEPTVEELKLKRYEHLMSLENSDVIPNSVPIECPICFAPYGPCEGVILRDCLHMFCRTCIANTIMYCEEAEVKCPFRDSEYTCESTLQEREIKALVTPEIYEQHLAKSVSQAENNAGNNAFHCKTPDCPGWCIYDDNVNIFLCPVCESNNCLTCQAIHMNKNCREYQDEIRLLKETDQETKRTAAVLEEMVESGEALACPTCAVVLMKKWGCDWLRCSMCKTEICWVTRGPRWGPAGKGDTSGGCKCGENGVKCHPRCNYCH